MKIIHHFEDPLRSLFVMSGSLFVIKIPKLDTIPNCDILLEDGLSTINCFYVSKGLSILSRSPYGRIDVVPIASDLRVQRIRRRFSPSCDSRIALKYDWLSDLLGSSERNFRNHSLPSSKAIIIGMRGLQVP